MTNKKNETDSCILCNHENCAKCNLNKDLHNAFAPNEQTQRLVKDGYLMEETIAMIHKATLAARCMGE